MNVKEFVRTIFGSFFSWWWVVITGVASLIGAISTPDSTTISKSGIVFLILGISTLLFLTISTVYQGFRLLRSQNGRVTKIIVSNEYGGDYVFMIEGLDSSFKGKIVELRRDTREIEVSFALIELVETNAAGAFQAKPIWLSPGHQYDLKRGKFSKNDIVVESRLNSETLQKWFNESR